LVLASVPDLDKVVKVLDEVLVQLLLAAAHILHRSTGQKDR
jgi:hypothetical protein